MEIKQPPNMSINTPNGYFNLKWTKNFGKLRSDKFLAVQQYVDSQCIERMERYTPAMTGVLCKSPAMHTKIGSGYIYQDGPYARYLYYGEIYGPNIPILENGQIIGFFSHKGKRKAPTGRPLHYSTEKHKLAGKMWFERMKADKKDVILRGAARIAGGKAE